MRLTMTLAASLLLGGCSALFKSPEEKVVDGLVELANVAELIRLAVDSSPPHEVMSELAVEALRETFQAEAIDLLLELIIANEEISQSTREAHIVLFGKLAPEREAEVRKARACSEALPLAIAEWTVASARGADAIRQSTREAARLRRAAQSALFVGDGAHAAAYRKAAERREGEVELIRGIFQDSSTFLADFLDRPVEAWKAVVQIRMAFPDADLQAAYTASVRTFEACGPDEPVFFAFGERVPFDGDPAAFKVVLGEAATCSEFEGTVCVAGDPGAVVLRAHCSADACLGDDNPLEELYRAVKAQLELIGDEPPPGMERTWEYESFGVEARYNFVATDAGYFGKSLVVKTSIGPF